MHAASIGNYRFKDVQSVSLWTSVTNTKELTHPLVHCPTLNESVLVTAPRQGQLKLLFKRLGMLQEEHEAAECVRRNGVKNLGRLNSLIWFDIGWGGLPSRWELAQALCECLAAHGAVPAERRSGLVQQRLDLDLIQNEHLSMTL